MKKIELLSPAGDLERLKITLLYGADAVYIGGREYSLRANATNFSIEEIQEACIFAHQLGKKVYLTLNIVFHDEDYEGVEDYIKQVVDAGIDAFIVSDPAIIKYIKDNYSSVEVHVSTQNTNTNYQSALFFKSLGVDRVVLARELALDEIKTIASLGIDTEVFIHGAMCACYSGRCALSSYYTNRDANRGGCSQVCRFLFNSPSGNFSIAAKDNNLTHWISTLIEAGVTSLKVEGRMRSAYYLATVIASYRRLIDHYYNKTLTGEIIKEEEKILSRVANRDTSDHFIKGECLTSDQYYLTKREELTNQDFVGTVLEYQDDLLKISLKNNLKKTEEIILFTPSGKQYAFKVTMILDQDKNELEVANHPMEIYYIKCHLPYKHEEYSMLKRRIND